jgi:2-keto-4-pentenoate hydratase/2-oxohepta-3-ene-1,7-dioic acid hydratase in catechol pathway
MKRTLIFVVASVAVLGGLTACAEPGADTARTVEAAYEPGTTQEWVRYTLAGETHWGELEGETVHQLTAAPYEGGGHTGVEVQRSEVRLEAPVQPIQIFMTAFNFRSHITGEPAEYPGIFLIPPTSIIGPEDAIVRPAESRSLHYEAEALAVISRRAENVSVEEAGDYIFGVTAGNDVSERLWQARDLQWSRAKGSRGFNAVGPVLVSGLDEKNLDIEGRLNGERVQGENTSDLIYPIDYMVSYISQYFTLLPGDLVWTGTMGSTRAMDPGDVFEVEVSGVGILRNEVVQGR